MSKVVRIHEQGPPEVLRIENLEVGEPGAGELRVRVEAIGLNRSEAAFRAGRYPVKPKLPTPMGYEAAGVVEALGPACGIQGWRPRLRAADLSSGRVRGVCRTSHRAGAQRDACAAESGRRSSRIHLDAVLHRAWRSSRSRERRSAIRRSSAPLRAASAWQRYSSPTGRARRQSPRLATARKRQALKAQGAKHVIATEESDFVAEVMRITGGKGARIVFDPVGGPYVEHAGAGHGRTTASLHLWRVERPADHALSALARGLQGPEHARLGGLGRSGTSRSASRSTRISSSAAWRAVTSSRSSRRPSRWRRCVKADPAGHFRGPPEAGDRPDVQAG